MSGTEGAAPSVATALEPPLPALLPGCEVCADIAVAAGREAATSLAPVLLHQAAALRRIAASSPPPAQAAELLGHLLPGDTRCPACAVAQRAEAEAVERLAAMVRHDGPLVVNARSAMCLPHMRRLAAALTDATSVASLLRRQGALMERLAEDASRFALKQDAARQGSLNTEERSAARRATRVLLDDPQAPHDDSDRRQG